MSGGETNTGHGIAVDGSENVLVTGEFRGTINFEPGEGAGSLTSGGIFVAKLDTIGNFVWAVPGTSSGAEGRDVAVDASANVYTTGKFLSTVDFGPGEGTAETVGGSGVFVSKLNSSGGFVWAKSMGSTQGGERGEGVAVDGSGSIYTTGWFGGGTADFDPGAFTFNLTSAGERDIFVSKLVVSSPGIITSNYPPGFVEVGSTWVLTAPNGIGHS